MLSVIFFPWPLWEASLFTHNEQHLTGRMLTTDSQPNNNGPSIKRQYDRNAPVATTYSVTRTGQQLNTLSSEQNSHHVALYIQTNFRDDFFVLILRF